MIRHTDLSTARLHGRIRRGNIRLGGNRKLKIYGRLDCAAGKRMKKENRVFFTGRDEALENGYRPCGTCLRAEYNLWKNATV